MIHSPHQTMDYNTQSLGPLHLVIKYIRSPIPAQSKPGHFRGMLYQRKISESKKTYAPQDDSVVGVLAAGEVVLNSALLTMNQSRSQ